MSELPKGWDRKPVSELCELIVDCVNKTAPLAKEPTPYKMIRTPNVKKGKVSLDGCRHVEREVFEKWTRRAAVLRGDVLLTREAPLGEVGMVKTDESIFLGQRIMQYRADKSKLYPHFLLYSFLSRDLQYQFRMHEGSGSVVSHIRVGDCLKFELSIPPLHEQKAIADMLSSFDDKIELLREQNKTLETLAQTIFKEWFVHFNFPDQHGNSYRNNGGEMVESELGLIPKGWRVGKLGDVVNIKQGKYVKADRIADSTTDNQKHPIYGGNGIRGYIDSFVYETPQVILTCRGNGCGLIVLAEEKSTITNSCMAFEDMNSCVNANFLYFLTKRIDFESVTSGSAQPQITVTNLYGLEILVPEKAVLKMFDDFVKPVLDKIQDNKFQIQTLSKTRDTLLPKLMSGQVRVSA